jgi:hypothetical protein
MLRASWLAPALLAAALLTGCATVPTWVAQVAPWAVTSGERFAAEQAIETCDCNKDGKLSAEEARPVVVNEKARPLGLGDGHLSGTNFKDADRDGDGLLTVDEIEALGHKPWMGYILPPSKSPCGQ